MRRTLALAMIILGALGGCSDGDGGPLFETVYHGQLSMLGLEDLGPNAAYEGWIIVDGAPISTGVFTVDADGNPSDTTLYVSGPDLAAATTFVLTIEPVPDPDPAPAATHILAGDFTGSTALLSVGHPAAIGDTFGSAAGIFILATPTDGPATDENSGVWFIDAGNAGLQLPTLPAGWSYEGWAVIDGVPVTTGTFLDPAAADDAAPYSGAMAGPPFPGEDFLMNAPGGLTFPTDLAGMRAVISVEPSPDNSPAPFTIKPLVGDIPVGATDGIPFTMLNHAGSAPTGRVTR